MEQISRRGTSKFGSRQPDEPAIHRPGADKSGLFSIRFRPPEFSGFIFKFALPFLPPVLVHRPADSFRS
jgi:hypothetical protein